MADPDQRLRVSLRLKAARFLGGGCSKGGRAVAITPADLAAEPVLVTNDITRNRIEDIEQMKVDARPMELERIADALKLPRSFLTDALTDAVEGLEPTPADAIAYLQRATALMQAVARQQGRDVGLRDLQLRAVAGRSSPPEEGSP